MVVHGTLTALNQNVGPALSGLAGMGHIILTAGLVLFFIVLKGRIFENEKQS